MTNYEKIRIVVALFVTSLAVRAQAVNTGGTALPRPATCSR